MNVSPPAMRATRRRHSSPAALTTASASMVSRGVTTASRPGARLDRTSGVPTSRTPPCALHLGSQRAARTLPPRSTRCPATRARRRRDVRLARSRRTPRSTFSRPAPLAAALAASASSAASSSPGAATINLPHRTCGTSCSRAECVQPLAPLDAQPRLQRVGRIVEAGVDHAAVVRGRRLARPRVPLEDADRAPAPRDRQRRGQPDDAGADDDDHDDQ